MIKNMRLRLVCDPRGKITSGEKSEKGFPKSLDHFNLKEFPELRGVYGDTPKELTLCFPSDTITDFFDCEFSTYGSNNQKKRTCDGEQCIHRIPETIGGATYQAGECSPCICQTMAPTDKEKCKYVAYLRAWIILPSTGKVDNPMCYLFMTHSQNSGDAIYSELEKIKLLNRGSLRGVPFKLSVKMVSGKTDAKSRFPIWTLSAIGMVSEIRHKANLLLERKNEI